MPGAGKTMTGFGVLGPVSDTPAGGVTVQLYENAFVALTTGETGKLEHTDTGKLLMELILVAGKTVTCMLLVETTPQILCVAVQVTVYVPGVE